MIRTTAIAAAALSVAAAAPQANAPQIARESIAMSHRASMNMLLQKIKDAPKRPASKMRKLTDTSYLNWAYFNAGGSCSAVPYAYSGIGSDGCLTAPNGATSYKFRCSGGQSAITVDVDIFLGSDCQGDVMGEESVTIDGRCGNNPIVENDMVTVDDRLTDDYDVLQSYVSATITCDSYRNIGTYDHQVWYSDPNCEKVTAYTGWNADECLPSAYGVSAIASSRCGLTVYEGTECQGEGHPADDDGDDYYNDDRDDGAHSYPHDDDRGSHSYDYGNGHHSYDYDQSGSYSGSNFEPEMRQLDHGYGYGYGYGYGGSACQYAASDDDSLSAIYHPAPYYTEENYCNSGDDDDYYGDDDDNWCFAGSETVLLQSGATKAMRDVAVGDMVQVVGSDGSLSFSEVVFLPHGANAERATFSEIQMASGKSLRATPTHFVMASECGANAFELTAMQYVSAGHCVQTIAGEDEVTGTDMVVDRGVYTLVTKEASGLVVVNGVHASSFGGNHWLVNQYYNLHRALYEVAPSLMTNRNVVAANLIVGDIAISL